MRCVLTLVVTTLLLLNITAPTNAQTAGPASDFLEFVKVKAEELRAGDAPPANRAEWEARRELLREQLLRAWGGFPEVPCPLEPQVLGTLERGEYRIEKIIFQTRPNIWMTANAYVPRGASENAKVPAVLCVHGHWRGAKQDPVVQQRCIGLAKLGFFVLVVDAFGAGERGIGKALGEYHGEMTAATLLPVGLPLSGLQVYENQRAVDYLATRPEVDASKIGITGASGGGNQSTYAGAWDERFGAVTPVCSVGNYHVYLGVACCMCELLPGALRFTDQGDVLGMTAPRGLMVISATKDAPQFAVSAAKKSVTRAKRIADLYGSDSVVHTIVEAPHDYNREMREAMYGWMTRFLKQEGGGSPIAEPEMQTEDPETLRCFPGDTRPDNFVTIPQFAAAEGRRLLAARTPPADAAAWRRERARLVDTLDREVLGGTELTGPLEIQDEAEEEDGCKTFSFTSEPGIRLRASVLAGDTEGKRLAVLLNLEGAEQARGSQLARDLREAGWSVLVPELRATGRLAWPHDAINHAPDHNTAQWAMWIGRPLLGQWVGDVRRACDALVERTGAQPDEIAIFGQGPAGVVALCAAALDERFTRATAIETLASYITDEPYRGQRVGILAPNIVREVGDIPHLAALVAPRPVTIAGAVWGNGKSLSASEIVEAYQAARHVFALENAESQLRFTGPNVAARP